MDGTELLNCKLCGSTNIVRFGWYRGIQRLWCKDCRRKFAANSALPDMKTPVDEVAAAIDMYFEGTRLSAIPGLLFRRHGLLITSASVYRWIARFSRLAVEKARDSRLNVGDSWIIIETSGRNDIRDIKLSLVDIIDMNTHFLLATGLSQYLNRYDIKALMETAGKRAGKDPGEVLTDGWQGYLHGIGLAGEKGRSDILVAPFRENETFEIMQSWYRATNSRTRIIQGLKKKEAAQLVLDGWSIHYNYIRPHEMLNGKTPGEAAAAGYKFHSWLEIVTSTKNH